MITNQTNQVDTFISDFLSDIKDSESFEVIEHSERKSCDYTVLYSFGQRKVFFISESFVDNHPILEEIFQNPIVFEFSEYFTKDSNSQEISESEVIEFIKKQLIESEHLNKFMTTGIDSIYFENGYQNRILKNVLLAKNIQATKQLGDSILKKISLPNLLLVTEENKWFVSKRLEKLKSGVNKLTDDFLSSDTLPEITDKLLNSLQLYLSDIISYKSLVRYYLTFDEVFPTPQHFCDSTIIVKMLQSTYEKFGSFLDTETCRNHYLSTILKFLSIVDEMLFSSEELTAWLHQKLQYLDDGILHYDNEIERNKFIETTLHSFYENGNINTSDDFEINLSSRAFFYFFKALDEIDSQPTTKNSISLKLDEIKIHQILNYLNLPPLLQLLQKNTHSGLFTEETEKELELLQNKIEMKVR